MKTVRTYLCVRSSVPARIATALAVAALAACAANQEIAPQEEERAQAPADPAPGTEAQPEAQPPTTDRREEIIERGTGSFVRATGAPPEPAAEQGDINFRFEATDIREFVEIVLGDILGVNYVIDPAVTGMVTVYMSQPVTTEQVLPLFEEVLSLHGAALVRSGGVYEVLPTSTAAQRDARPATIPAAAPGYRTQVIPLQYISAVEMEKILEPLVADADSIRIDVARNLIFASGTAAEVQTIQDTIRIFDVDWLRGMSVGLYPLDNVDPRTLENELTDILNATAGQGDGDPLGGIVRLVPLERLTSLLVVSATPAALREVETWIRRLDRAGESAGRRLYVYSVQNAKAIELADILGGIFGSSRRATATATATPETSDARAGDREIGLAPGLEPVQLGPGSSRVTRPTLGGQGGAGSISATSTDPGAGAGTGTTSSIAISGSSQIEIIADDVRNALVILASPQDYRMVESAIRRLDVVPLQVLIEASILEVTLRDDLSYGVEWFFQNSLDGGDKDGFGLLDLGSPGITALAPGFSYTVVDDANNVRVALNLLASESEVNVLSSPSLMVLDNQTATINVGDEIPIPTRQSTSNIDPGAPTVNEITFRQTGVSLSVTPRVNNSGLVTMEIRQEVANAAVTTTSNIDAPTIQNRQIESVVAINSGDTIVLGGLIQDQDSVSESGFPLLRRIPGLGKLFSATVDENSRTELLVLITPRVVRNREDARRITEELREKVNRIRLYESERSGESS